MMKDKNKKSKLVYSVLMMLFTFLMGINGCITAQAVDSVEEMTRYPNVTLSPDGTAWTTDYMDRTNEHKPEGYTVYTGQSSRLRETEQGEHYYRAPATGSVPIGKWVVSWEDAQCIHGYDIVEYKGFHTNPGICESYYNNGWLAYCADCNECVEILLFYAREVTVRGILSMPASSEYVYLCPNCRGLEQGTSYQHICKKISYNHYSVSYAKNAPKDADVTGFMADTRHMYNNADTYEGRSASEAGYGDKKLRKNTYMCTGYVFEGWNTEPDGSGTFLADEAEVWNLTDEEGGVKTLYAQWKKAVGTLVLDANGGSYHGEGVHSITQQSGTEYYVDIAQLTPAAGHEVRFETNGGSAAATVFTRRELSHWEQQDDFQGRFQENLYTFPAIDGNRDTLKAQYREIPFTLPDSKKENEALAGWYKDASFAEESFVGVPGDSISVSEDTVLYAKWARLTLWAEDDYESNGGVGAVDLHWEQKDGQSKFYKLYQSLDQERWELLYEAGSKETVSELQEVFDHTKQGGQYMVTQAGYYLLYAEGAKGEDYNAQYGGGLGGSVSAEYWLQKGDILTFYAGTGGSGRSGGTNGSNGSSAGANGIGAGGGNASSENGRGGGAGTELYLTRNGQKTLLLAAGGGGGASTRASGGNGGEQLSAVASMAGQTAEYGGGGGGASGGIGGVKVVHHHEGNASSGGGCYVGRTTTAVCGSSRVAYDYYDCECGAAWGPGSHSYYGPLHEAHGYCHNIGYSCSGCGTSLSANQTHYKTVTVYVLNCAYADRPDGYVIRANPAGGGSNYINTGFGCRKQSSNAGVCSGNGSARLTGTDVGYQENTSLADVLARDMAAPQRIHEYAVSVAGDRELLVRVSAPQDFGTTYYHKAESYRISGSGIARAALSNITANTLTTGVVGYYYYVDTQPQGAAGVQHIRTADGKISVKMTADELYLHIAAVDAAGNIGETTDIWLKQKPGETEYPADESYTKAVGIYTEMSIVEDSEFVHRQNETSWFVKADGETEHTLLVTAGLNQAATFDFQVNGIRINVPNQREMEWLQLEIPYGSIARWEEGFGNDTIVMKSSETESRFMKPGPVHAKRKNHATAVEAEQVFCVDSDREAFYVYPSAYAVFNEEEYTSAEEQDVQHRIKIIPDAEAPEIFGLEELRQLKVVDMTEQSRQVVLEARDVLSGLKEFKVIVQNKDNHMREEFAADVDGRVAIEIRKDKLLFAGELEISAVAVDHVGNANVVGEDGLSFTLETRLYRERNPEENIVKAGDGAVLEIATSGYVERLEIVFPNELKALNPDLDCVFEYEKPALRQRESITFQIPLGIEEKEYEVVVKAYKKGQSLVDKPTLVVVKGTVLDELRTRIRNNG